jgi:hypothetical protein
MGKRIEAMELELMSVSCVYKVWASLRVSRIYLGHRAAEGQDETHVRISAMKPNMLGKSCAQRVLKMRICLEKHLTAQACSDIGRQGNGTSVLPAVAERQQDKRRQEEEPQVRGRQSS